MFSQTIRRRLRRWLGPHGLGRKTRILIEVETATPRDYLDPATDEVLLLDTLDHVTAYLMEFHDIPAVRVVSLKTNGKELL